MKTNVLKTGLVLLVCLLISCTCEETEIDETEKNNLVFFTSTRDNLYEIYSCKLDGSDLSRLTNNNFDDYCARIDPSKNKIAFVSNRTGQYQVFTMDLDGENQTQITTAGISGGQYGNGGGHLGWTSDGKIVYTKANKLYKCNADGSGSILIYTAPSGRNLSGVRCSPSGNKIAIHTMGPWAYDSEIYLINPDGSNITILVPNNRGALHLGSFSNDGLKLGYMYDISGNEESSGRQLDTHIFLVDLDGKNTIDLSSKKPTGTIDYSPAFVTGTDQIVFTNSGNIPGSVSELWIMKNDGSNRKKILEFVIDPVIR